MHQLCVKEFAMKLSFLEKLNIYFDMKNYSYSSKVDEILESFMQEGKFIEFKYCTALLEYKGKQYEIWIANHPYASLSNLLEVGTERIRIYDKLRPSRKMQVKFFEWLCEQSGYTGDLEDMSETESAKNDRGIKHFLEE